MTEAGLKRGAARRGGAVARLRSPTTIWARVWLLATLIDGAIVISDQHLDQPFVVKGSVAIVAQLAATVALLAWLGPVPTSAWRLRR
jgi:hypothetical protein